MNDKEIEVLNTIFEMVAKDPEFRNKLLTEPSSVLDQYDLTDEAKNTIIDAIRDVLNR